MEFSVLAICNKSEIKRRHIQHIQIRHLNMTFKSLQSFILLPDMKYLCSMWNNVILTQSDYSYSLITKHPV